MADKEQVVGTSWIEVAGFAGCCSVSRIGIIGAGHLGTVLAKRLVAKGHAVKVANSRGRGSLQDFARLTGAKATDVGDVATDVDILFIAIPLGRVNDLPKSMFAAMRQEITVVDTTNYVPPRDGAIADIDAGLPETAWVARELGLPAIKAFNSITDYSLEHNGRPKGSRGRIALPVAGDDAERRTVVMRLVENLGFDALDTGPLSNSWRQQIGQPAYCTDPTLRQLPRLLDRAEPGSSARKRDEAMKLMLKMPADFPKKDLVRAARLMTGLDIVRPASWLAVLRLGLALQQHRK